MPSLPGSQSAPPSADADSEGSLRGRPFQSLPSRIILSVFGAAFVTSLVVTLVSTSSIESFLRQKIDQKFPATLLSTAEHLDLWYSQRRLDVETFARSTTLMDNAPELASPSAKGGRSREEVGKYLQYVLERFPQYAAIFALDPDGGELLWVGERTSLPAGLRSRLAGVTSSQVGDVHEAEGIRIQAVSAPIADGRGAARGSLHALVRPESLVPVLGDHDLGPSGVVFVVGRGGEVLAQSADSSPRRVHERPLPESGEDVQVADYTGATGAHVVGASLRFPRFGWTVVCEEDYDQAFAPVVSIIGRILAINLGIVVLFGFVAYQFARSIVRPVHALSDGARRIAEGETGVVVPLPSTRDEIEVLARVFNEMSARLEANQHEIAQGQLEIEKANKRLVSQNQELHRVNEALEQLSITDDLTKLHNHRFFHDSLLRENRRAARSGEPLSLVLIDLDDFKQVNDRYGHASGDALLRQAGEVMNAVVRENDLLARYGGEEFALIAPRTALEGALVLGEKLRLAVAEADFTVEGEPVRVTVSVGVAESDGDARELFKRADAALYEAKGQGKDCVVVADEPADD